MRRKKNDCLSAAGNRALWFPWAWNCQWDHFVGQLKQKSKFGAEYPGNWPDFTKVLFFQTSSRRIQGPVFEGNCTEGFGWHIGECAPPPLQTRWSSYPQLRPHRQFKKITNPMPCYVLHKLLRHEHVSDIDVDLSFMLLRTVFPSVPPPQFRSQRARGSTFITYIYSQFLSI